MQHTQKHTYKVQQQAIQCSAIHVGGSGKYKKAENKLKIQAIHKLNKTQKIAQREIQQNKTTLVQLPFTTTTTVLDVVYLLRTMRKKITTPTPHPTRPDPWTMAAVRALVGSC